MKSRGHCPAPAAAAFTFNLRTSVLRIDTYRQCAGVQ
jgi:hypothetical protein